MEDVITDISLSSDLLHQAEEAANEMEVSRSRLFAVAVEDFLRRRENQRLQDQINEAYADFPDPDEQKMLEGMRLHQRRLLEGEW
ncbi:MAG: hypothetical protein M3X11_17190 [Acidobacteriota bacterium]|nr:hypothetical protein [Acidobacteriota bacterium]